MQRFDSVMLTAATNQLNCWNLPDRLFIRVESLESRFKCWNNLAWGSLCGEIRPIINEGENWQRFLTSFLPLQSLPESPAHRTSWGPNQWVAKSDPSQYERTQLAHSWWSGMGIFKNSKCSKLPLFRCFRTRLVIDHVHLIRIRSEHGNISPLFAHMNQHTARGRVMKGEECVW